MKKRIVQPRLDETLKYGRRSFLRRMAVAVGGLGVLGGIAPNLILNPVYGGTALIVDSSGDKRISLSNSSFARPFDIGTWSSLRVCLRAAAQGAEIVYGNPKLCIGLCSGSTNQVFDATTTNFIGSRSANATFYWSASTPDYYNNGTAMTKGAKRVGSTWTETADTIVAAAKNEIYPVASEAGADGTSVVILDITKGSPNWTVSIFVRDAITNWDVTRATFLTQIVALTPSVAGHYVGQNRTLAFDEVAGTVDHVQVGWDHFQATIEISDLAIVKMAA